MNDEATLTRIEGRVCHASDGSTWPVPDFLEVFPTNDRRFPDPDGTWGWIMRYPIAGRPDVFNGYAVPVGMTMYHVKMGVDSLYDQRARGRRQWMDCPEEERRAWDAARDAIRRGEPVPV